MVDRKLDSDFEYANVAGDDGSFVEDSSASLLEGGVVRAFEPVTLDMLEAALALYDGGSMDGSMDQDSTAENPMVDGFTI